MPRNKKPIATFRLGRIRAAVWENDTAKGQMCNVTFERVYLENEEWKSSTTFGRQDLPLIAQLADEALVYIYRRKREQANDEPTDEEIPY